MTSTGRLLTVLMALLLVLAACSRNQDPEPSDPIDEPSVEQPDPEPRDPTPSDPSPSNGESGDPTVEMPMFEDASCEFQVPEGRSVRCGWLEVPADRETTSSTRIRLHVAVFESESDSPAPDPVVYLEGGPGGDALESLPLVFEDRFAHLVADRDVVFFDQRGTGFSEPSLACQEIRQLGLDTLEQDLTSEEYIPLQDAAIVECRERLAADGADLDAYHSAASAADLAELRLALGYDEWNLYGISYGTRLALTTLRDHPEGIRSVVLDSAYPLDVDLIAETPANLDRALNELFAGCADDPDCAAAYPSLEETFYGLLTSLEDDPLRAEVRDLSSGSRYDAVFDGPSIGGIVFQSLYSEEIIPVLPRLIDNVASGETYELSLLASSFLANGEFVSIGMQYSVQCQEEVAFTTPEALAAGVAPFPELEPLFEDSSNLGGQVFNACNLWGVGERPAFENAPVRSDVPVLVTAGEYDPITPPAWGIRAATTLPNATFVEFPGLGHASSVAAGCPREIVLGFLADPSVPPDLSCAAEMSSPAFLLPDTPPPGVELVPFDDSLFGLTGLVPNGWESVAPGTWVRAASGLDQTTLLQQFAPATATATLESILASQLGVDAFVPAGEYTSAVGTWRLLESELLGAPVFLALVDTDGGAGIVLMIVEPTEAEALRQAVYLPVLDAFTVN